jgi:hypothetical protein
MDMKVEETLLDKWKGIQGSREGRAREDNGKWI